MNGTMQDRSLIIVMFWMRNVANYSFRLFKNCRIRKTPKVMMVNYSKIQGKSRKCRRYPRYTRMERLSSVAQERVSSQRKTSINARAARSTMALNPPTQMVVFNLKLHPVPSRPHHNLPTQLDRPSQSLSLRLPRDLNTPPPPVFLLLPKHHEIDHFAKRRHQNKTTSSPKSVICSGLCIIWLGTSLAPLPAIPPYCFDFSCSCLLF